MDELGDRRAAAAHLHADHVVLGRPEAIGEGEVAKAGEELVDGERQGASTRHRDGPLARLEQPLALGEPGGDDARLERFGSVVAQMQVQAIQTLVDEQAPDGRERPPHGVPGRLGTAEAVEQPESRAEQLVAPGGEHRTGAARAGTSPLGEHALEHDGGRRALQREVALGVVAAKRYGVEPEQLAEVVVRDVGEVPRRAGVVGDGGEPARVADGVHGTGEAVRGGPPGRSAEREAFAGEAHRRQPGVGQRAPVMADAEVVARPIAGIEGLRATARARAHDGHLGEQPGGGSRQQALDQLELAPCRRQPEHRRLGLALVRPAHQR